MDNTISEKEKNADDEMIVKFTNWAGEIFKTHLEIIKRMQEAGAFIKKQ